MNGEPRRDRSMSLGDRAWPNVGRPVLLVPVGSCEQHGPHLPLDTDTIIAVELSRRAAMAANAVVAPPIAIGASGEHGDFPGTLSIGTTVTTQVLIEVARSASWARQIVFVNGHGGNAAALRDAIDVCHHDGRDHVSGWTPTSAMLDAIAPDDTAGDLHAGLIETSVMLFLRPDLVGDERTAQPVDFETWTILRERGVQAVSPSGVLGDPSAATADYGESIVSVWTDALVTYLSRTDRASSAG